MCDIGSFELHQLHPWLQGLCKHLTLDPRTIVLVSIPFCPCLSEYKLIGINQFHSLFIKYSCNVYPGLISPFRYSAAAVQDLSEQLPLSLYLVYLSFQLLRNHRILQHINYSFLYLKVLVESKLFMHGPMGHQNISFVS